MILSTKAVSDEFCRRLFVFFISFFARRTQNVLRVALMRKRLTLMQVFEIVELLHTLQLQTDEIFKEDFSKKIIELAQLYNLSAYDATYLELAIRKKAKLMTADKALKDAAMKAGV